MEIRAVAYCFRTGLEGVGLQKNRVILVFLSDGLWTRLYSQYSFFRGARLTDPCTPDFDLFRVRLGREFYGISLVFVDRLFDVVSRLGAVQYDRISLLERFQTRSAQAGRWSYDGCTAG